MAAFNKKKNDIGEFAWKLFFFTFVTYFMRGQNFSCLEVAFNTDFNHANRAFFKKIS